MVTFFGDLCGDAEEKEKYGNDNKINVEVVDE